MTSTKVAAEAVDILTVMTKHHEDRVYVFLDRISWSF